eukprot:PhM_4_TR16443/c0_g1_i1/m.69357
MKNFIFVIAIIVIVAVAAENNNKNTKNNNNPPIILPFTTHDGTFVDPSAGLGLYIHSSVLKTTKRDKNEQVQLECLSGPEPSATPLSGGCPVPGEGSKWSSAVLALENGATTARVTFIIIGGRRESVVTKNATVVTSAPMCGWTQTATTCSWTNVFSNEHEGNDDDGPFCNSVTDAPLLCSGLVFSAATKWVFVPKVNKVHLLFMNHLDVGYHVGDNPELGFVNNVINRYFNVYFPRAVALHKAVKANASLASKGFVYTTHPWLVDLYMDCLPMAILSGIQLKCPSAAEKNDFVDAVREGGITYHAGPFNMQPENMDKSLFTASLSIAKKLDMEFGFVSTDKQKRVLSQRDVPGMTRGVIPILAANNISAISVGSNPFTCPAHVPKVFWWRDVASGTEVLALHHPYGYPNRPGNTTSPGGLSRGNCVTLTGFDEVMCWAFRDDNDGPPVDLDEIQGNFDVAQHMFPGSNVVASTFDAFVGALLSSPSSVLSSLPVITKEIGDVWIQGVASDPVKIATNRALARVRAKCIASGRCDANAPHMYNMSRFLIKPAEHTWGLPGIFDPTASNFSNANLEANWLKKGYRDADKSWAEQRQFNTWAMDAVRDADPSLYLELQDALDELVPSVPESVLSGKAKTWQPDGHDGNLHTMCNGEHIVVSGTSGALLTKNSIIGGELHYTVFTEREFTVETSRCNVVFMSHEGMDKTANINGTSVEATAVVTGAFLAEDDDPCVAYVRLSFANKMFTVDYGAPEVVWYTYNFTNSSSSQTVLDVQTFNKTSTMVAESLSLHFLLSATSIVLEKLSTTVDITTEVVDGGNWYNHAVTDGDVVVLGTNNVRLHSFDAPLVMPIIKHYNGGVVATPLVPGVTRPDPTTSTYVGVAYNLFNNVWGTNYPAYYPFEDKTDSSRSFKQRFKIIH